MNSMMDNHNKIKPYTNGRIHCEKCGTLFKCEIEEGKGRCWCMNINPSEKHLENLNQYSKCVCKKCLTEED